MGYKKMDQSLGFALMKSAPVKWLVDFTGQTSLLLTRPKLNRRKSGVEWGKNFMGQADFALVT